MFAIRFILENVDRRRNLGTALRYFFPVREQVGGVRDWEWNCLKCKARVLLLAATCSFVRASMPAQFASLCVNEPAK